MSTRHPSSQVDAYCDDLESGFDPDSYPTFDGPDAVADRLRKLNGDLEWETLTGADAALWDDFRLYLENA